MDLIEEQIHSFIVRVWLEESGDEARPLQWRGHITHVLSNDRAYVTSMAEINDFIAGYLHLLKVDNDSQTVNGG